MYQGICSTGDRCGDDKLYLQYLCPGASPVHDTNLTIEEFLLLSNRINLGTPLAMCPGEREVLTQRYRITQDREFTNP